MCMAFWVSYDEKDDVTSNFIFSKLSICGYMGMKIFFFFNFKS